MKTVSHVLSLESVHHRVGARSLLADLDLEVFSGESVAVMGPSGSGKSTLLSVCLGMLRPTSGVVKVAGTDIGRLRGRRLAQHRSATTGMVFQFGELLPELTPLDNVALPALMARQSRGEAYERAADLMARLGLKITDTPTADLSGGERQRVAVARAMINSPQLIMADEPTGSLDDENRGLVADYLFDLPRRSGCGLLVVTHDVDVASQADRCLTLVGGKLHANALSDSPS